MSEIPKPNTQAADFGLPDGNAQTVRLSDYRGKNVVLVFYPADWSPVCTSELALIQETLDDIHEFNAEVLGISVDGRHCHRAWAESQHLTFPLLSDFWPHGAVAQQYGVFNEKNGKSERALFFIDETGTLRDTWVAEDPGIAPGINIIFKALEQIHGPRKEQARHAV
jgi:peroxiredoxin